MKIKAPSNKRRRAITTWHFLCADKSWALIHAVNELACETASPPQTRRGGPKGRGGVDQEIDFLKPPRRFVAPLLRRGGEAVSRQFIHTPIERPGKRFLSCAVLSILFAASQLLAQSGAVVTDTMRIEIDKRVHTARKINGRWWSEDNRELTETNVGWIWNVSGGNAWQLVRFDHHRPVDPSKANSLDRAMGPDQVRAILGPPNSVFPSDKPDTQQQWDYYGAGGYKLSIHFNSSGGIFTATYEPDAKSRPKDVPHLAFRVNGKTAQELSEERRNEPRRQVPASQEEFRRQLQEEINKRRAR